MDRSCHSTGDSASSTTTTATSSSLSNTRDHYLKHLHKLSHKISKPPLSAPSRPPLDPSSGGLDHSNSHHSNLQQPPVYNINKSDFRQVVQKLTGSPAHDRLASPPPIQPPRPPSSRLHRIRPPPLAQLNRPPPVLDCAGPQNQNPNLTNQFQIAGSAAINNQICRPGAPLSPLPPLPSVHAAAESPVSAYMRYLQSSGTNQFAGFSPLGTVAPIPPPPASAPPPPQFQLPLSPLPFGRLNSPKSPYPLFSPTSGFPQFPLSPVPSPKGGGV